MPSLKTCLPILLISCIAWTSSYAQSIRITGQITDQVNGQPLASAHVYLAQTTFGSSTEATGKYIFLAKPGRYELVISHVEYTDTVFSLNLVRDTSIQISLKPAVQELSQILVQADTSQWEANYQVFRKHFLGTTIHAQSTQIENPRALYLYFDAEENMFYAHAREEISILNEALGYRIIYHLKDFEINFNSGFMKSYGIPRFEFLRPKSRKQEKRWLKNRERAYKGSFNHLLDAIRNEDIQNNKFILQEIFRNKVVDDLSLISEKVTYYRNKIMGSNVNSLRLNSGKSTFLDSLRYWQDLEKNGGYLDSTGSPINDSRYLMPIRNTIHCENILKVTYRGEPEELHFALERRIGQQSDTKQTSYLHFPQKKLEIANNGYYPVDQIVFDGYLGWASKIAEMLPLNYEPNP